jgi:hypothetical protein
VAEGHQADLIVGNNVLAHSIPTTSWLDEDRSSPGASSRWSPSPDATDGNQRYDSVEHFRISLLTAEKVFAALRMTLFDVEDSHPRRVSADSAPCGGFTRLGPAVTQVKLMKSARAQPARTYRASDEQVKETKRKLEFLITLRQEVQLSARRPGKGNTLELLRIRSDFIDYTVDRNPYKQQVRPYPYPHLSSRAFSRRGRLRADSALEPEGGDHRAAVLCA